MRPDLDCSWQPRLSAERWHLVAIQRESALEKKRKAEKKREMLPVANDLDGGSRQAEACAARRAKAIRL